MQCDRATQRRTGGVAAEATLPEQELGVGWIFAFDHSIFREVGAVNANELLKRSVISVCVLFAIPSPSEIRFLHRKKTVSAARRVPYINGQMPYLALETGVVCKGSHRILSRLLEKPRGTSSSFWSCLQRMYEIGSIRKQASELREQRGYL